MSPKTVAIFGVNYLALTVGAKVCEQGQCVVMFPTENSPAEERSIAQEFIKTVLSQINESSAEMGKGILALKPRFTMSSIEVSNSVFEAKSIDEGEEESGDQEDKPLLAEQNGSSKAPANSPQYL
eukprot:TRINITY_DN21860_c0_g1_i2.p2 TRINITY_DN21860_c0_g1~~TRINITY_DN21860_c0_g1_i2.p2  ORF type:complete len:125 (+),score=39.26 TRINITY_DN21860_c0_g1_i2:957-1331(+)